MSTEHLRQLENILEQNRWNIVRKRSGNDYDVSAYWDISRRDNNSNLTILFSGLDDMETLSIEKAYACELEGHPDISLYFSRIKKLWPNNLKDFIL